MKKLLKSIGKTYLFCFGLITLVAVVNIPYVLVEYTGIYEYYSLYLVTTPMLFGIVLHYIDDL